MTRQKHLKQLIRDRMAKTGERYAAARRHIVRQVERTPDEGAFPFHFPGRIPATTALRALLTHAGMHAPHTGAPFTEAMLFGIAGGIGIGVFSFYYEKEDVATFFVAGRRQWHDDLAYLRDALGRFGIAPTVREAGGSKAAAQQLREALAGGPAVAWVDMGTLPQRAMPASWSGGGYHVVTVYAIDEAAATAQIGDLTDEPIAIGLGELAAARARIAKQRNRLLSIPAGTTPQQPDLAALVRDGLRACHEGLLHPTLPGAGANAQLAAIRTWAERMAGTKGKERWERIYHPGVNMLCGLGGMYDFIEHYGTGGGLCRPIFAEFLHEAAAALSNARLAELAERYAALGRDWSALADAALPDDVPALRELKQLHARKAELLHAGAPPAEVRGVYEQIAAIEAQATEDAPLDAAAYRELRANLSARLHALYEAEIAAHAALDAIAGG
jgi:hypothetical protein